MNSALLTFVARAQRPRNLYEQHLLQGQIEKG